MQQIQAVAWSPDSRWIASTSGTEVQVWEALSGRLLHRFPDEWGFESVAWSPDGHYLAAGSWDRTVAVWQVATGHKVLTYRGHVQEQLLRLPKAGLTERAGKRCCSHPRLSWDRKPGMVARWYPSDLHGEFRQDPGLGGVDRQDPPQFWRRVMTFTEQGCGRPMGSIC